MKPHSPELVDQLRSISMGAGEQIYELAGLYAVRFAVITIPEVQKPFPLAVAAAFLEKNEELPVTPMNADNQFGGILVSDDVPTPLQGLWALHELLDFTVVGHGSPRRCAVSEALIHRALARDNKEDLSSKYAQARIGFFTGLERYMADDIAKNGDASQYEANDVTGCKLAAKLNRKLAL